MDHLKNNVSHQAYIETEVTGHGNVQDLRMYSTSLYRVVILQSTYPYPVYGYTLGYTLYKYLVAAKD